MSILTQEERIGLDEVFLSIETGYTDKKMFKNIRTLVLKYLKSAQLSNIFSSCVFNYSIVKNKIRL